MSGTPSPEPEGPTTPPLPGSPRLLMVSYDYLHVAPMGGQRAAKLARHLASLGWAPTVLTVRRDRTQWGREDPDIPPVLGVRVISAPFPDVLGAARDAAARLGLQATGGSGEEFSPYRVAGGGALQRLGGLVAAWAGRWATFPDRYWWWLVPAVLRGMRELRARRYEAIFSTSPPVTDHMVTAVLQRITGLPWLADYRDLWVGNEYLALPGARRRLEDRLERLVLRRADAISAVTQPFVDGLLARHGPRRHGYHCITNGFDPDEFAGLEAVAPEAGRLVLTFTGVLYGLKHDPAPLLAAMEELIEEGVPGADRMLLRVFGPAEPALAELRGRLRYPQILEMSGIVPRRDSLRRQRESTALVVLGWDNPYAAQCLSGKLFEYLGAGRPVLAWAPAGGPTRDVLESTGAGVAVSTPGELQEVLRGWLAELARTGRLAYHGDPEVLAQYRWDRLAEQFAAVLARLAPPP